MMTAMQQRSTDLSQRRQDGLAGAKPALYLALGLGAVTGGSVVIVMIVGALLLGSIGGIGSGASGFFALIGVSIAFWLGISFGVILGVTAGFRAWTALYPAYERREEAAEKRAALVEVELLLQGPENNRPPEDHTTG
jgi:hypothetical protein